MDTTTITRENCSQMEKLLRQNPLFARLTAQQLDEMCKYSKVINLKEGEILFHHGDKVHNFYFVYSGLIKLYRQSPSGQEKIIELEGAGKIFAEALMFLDEDNYPVSAAAMHPSSIVSINTHKFLNILKMSNDTCLLIMGDLSRRLHELVNDIEKLSLHTGRERLATYLLDQSITKGTEFKLEIAKNAIASMLSLQPETFSRLLKELCQKDVIQVKDNEIRILKIDKLKFQAGMFVDENEKVFG